MALEFERRVSDLLFVQSGRGLLLAVDPGRLARPKMTQSKPPGCLRKLAPKKERSQKGPKRDKPHESQ